MYVVTFNLRLELIKINRMRQNVITTPVKCAIIVSLNESNLNSANLFSKWPI